MSLLRQGRTVERTAAHRRKKPRMQAGPPARSRQCSSQKRKKKKKETKKRQDRERRRRGRQEDTVKKMAECVLGGATSTAWHSSYLSMLIVYVEIVLVPSAMLEDSNTIKT